MRRRLRSDRGFSLIEVLVAMLLTTFVLGTTLTAFTALWKTHKFTIETNDTQDRARTAIDRLARELRNLASPTDLTSAASTRPRSVDRDLNDDLVFQEVDETFNPGTVSSPNQNLANVKRVRYCLDSSTPENGKLYRQEQTWTTAAAPDMPTDTACPAPPSSGYQKTQVVATNITNDLNATRPLFRYSSDSGVVTGTDSATRATITRIEANLFLDLTAGRRPVETQISTGVQLRNQNREPTSSFTLTVLNAAQRQVQLNGSASEDPESQQLDYHWYVNGTEVGQGVVFLWKAPAAGDYTFQLKVYDPAGLEGASTTVTRTL